MKQRTITASEQETEEVAAQFAKGLKPGDFVAIYGRLGAGKTAFVRGLAKTLCPGARVTSPTFALVNEYAGAIPLFHFDLYRIRGEDDLYSIGFYDYLDRGGVIAAEWCENVPFALPENRYEVRIAPDARQGVREIEVMRL